MLHKTLTSCAALAVLACAASAQVSPPPPNPSPINNGNAYGSIIGHISMVKAGGSCDVFEVDGPVTSDAAPAPWQVYFAVPATRPDLWQAVLAYDATRQTVRVAWPNGNTNGTSNLPVTSRCPDPEGSGNWVDLVNPNSLTRRDEVR